MAKSKKGFEQFIVNTEFCLCFPYLLQREKFIQNSIVKENETGNNTGNTLTPMSFRWWGAEIHSLSRAADELLWSNTKFEKIDQITVII